MKTRLITILAILGALLFAALFIFVEGAKPILQFMLGVIVWDLGRTVFQTWYLNRQLTRNRKCSKCKGDINE